jgi:hypothetical protein
MAIRTGREKPGGGLVILTPGQRDRIRELSDLWSFFWDKRRSLWLAAEGCPDGDQLEEDALPARLSAIAAAYG